MQHDGWFQLQKTKSGWIQVKMIMFANDLTTPADDTNLSSSDRQQSAGQRVCFI